MLGSIPPYPLPYGVALITETTSNDYYMVPRSQVVCFAWQLGTNNTVRVIGQHVSFYDNQQNTVRVWASGEPNGRSITMDPNSGLESIRLNGDGYVWNFYSPAHPENQTQDANLNQWVDPSQTYFMCVQNLENKDNHFYLKFVYA